MIFQKRYYVNTTAAVDLLPVTHEVHYAIRDAGALQGLVTICVSGPGAGVMVCDAQPDVIAGIKHIVQGWEGGARVQSALVGRSVQLPFDNARVCLLPYTDVMLCDFELRVQRREFLIQVMGESAVAEAPPAGGENYEQY